MFVQVKGVKCTSTPYNSLYLPLPLQGTQILMPPQGVSEHKEMKKYKHQQAT